MRAKRASLTRPTGVWRGRKKLSVSFKPRSPFSAFVKLFVRRVYLDTQKYRLFCSLLLNLLSHRHSNSFHMRVFPRRILSLQPRDKAAMLVVCWWSIQQIFFSKNLHEMLFVLDQQHTTVTSHANHQLLMLVNM